MHTRQLLTDIPSIASRHHVAANTCPAKAYAHRSARLNLVRLLNSSCLLRKPDAGRELRLRLRWHPVEDADIVRRERPGRRSSSAALYCLPG